MRLWAYLEGLLLLANAFAILNEDRFLGRRGWILAEIPRDGRNTLKGQVIGLIHACQFFRFPLIFFNIFVIIINLVYG